MIGRTTAAPGERFARELLSVYRGAKGGFVAIAVFGDRLEGLVGCGRGHGESVTIATARAFSQAEVKARAATRIPATSNDTTVPVALNGKYRDTTVTILPADSRSGIVSGCIAASVLGAAGITDAIAFVNRLSDEWEVAMATMSALTSTGEVTPGGVTEIPLPNVSNTRLTFLIPTETYTQFKAVCAKKKNSMTGEVLGFMKKPVSSYARRLPLSILTSASSDPQMQLAGGGRRTAASRSKLTCIVPSDVHLDFKSKCTRAGKTMSQVLAQSIEQFLLDNRYTPF